MKTRKQVAELAALLAGRRAVNNPHWTAEDTLTICRIATTAQRIAVALCNGDIEQDRFDATKSRLLKKLEPLVAPYGVRFEIGGDPRGPVLRMHSATKQPLKGNTWGGDEEGYGI